jgi:DNA-binding NarL/FixJ family response regulator
MAEPPRAPRHPRRWSPGSVDAGEVTLLVMDGEQALAEALAAVFRAADWVAWAAVADSPAAAARVLDTSAVDVIVVGTDAEGADPLAVLRWVAGRYPQLALVAMSADDGDEAAARALEAGAVAWLPKSAGVEEMAAIVRRAAAGEASLPVSVLRLLVRRQREAVMPRHLPSVLSSLTARQREILEHAVLGFSRADIADELGLSVHTVRTHLQHILRKLGVHSTLEAVAMVLRERASTQRPPGGPLRPV